MKSAELEPPSEPPPEPVDNIPPSPFTLRASNSKKYQRPNRANKTSSDSAENNNSSTKLTEAASAQDKTNKVFTANASSTPANANTAAKPPGRGGGRVRDYTVLHPSCLSVCNVTIQDSMERSMDELVTPAAPVDLGEAGQMKKKSDVPAPKPIRYVLACHSPNSTAGIVEMFYSKQFFKCENPNITAGRRHSGYS